MPSRIDSEDLTSELEPPTTIDPYAILSISQDATQSQIKSAYRRAALQYHPDKTSAPDATQKFQEVAFAYAVLSDKRRRARYDATGRTEESLHPSGDDSDDEFDWRSFYTAQYEDVVSAASIEAFRKEYKGSTEEKEHVLAAYDKGKGNMDVVFEQVMLSEVEADEARFRDIIQAAIDGGEAKAYKRFAGETEKSKKARRLKAGAEAKEADELAEELGLKDQLAGKSKRGAKGAAGGEDALQALIMQRQKGRAEGFLADLEAKYAPKSKGKKTKADKFEEPPEELFAQNRKRGKEDGEEAKAGKKSKRSKA